ncbi:sensor domain-containing protein [Nocardia yamanashiensis]|uniref:sensor histidine kinase n=1 Tax=Nocardia yamanashiensis TaxID=209247 RepID=UPI001E43225A|nr:sensor domain-containing protein [Nocardia yamanashiensis]UGT40326.1 sensor domain-containing protein [Nocardia yamanashiensis]
MEHSEPIGWWEWVRARVRALPGAVAYLALGGVSALLAVFAVVALLIVLAASFVGLGIPAVPEALRMIRPLVAFDRRQAGKLLGEPLVVRYEPFEGGLGAKLATVARDPANRRDVAWLVVHALPGIVLGALALVFPIAALAQLTIPLYWRAAPAGQLVTFGFEANTWPRALAAGLLGVPLAWLALQIPVVARWQARVARTLLGPAPDAGLAVRVAELTATRAAALDAHGAELRRIERDLHDGAQARIAAVIMQLGLADRLRQQNPAAADDMVRTAQDTATAALAELRDVVRSVYPPVLADRGLASAISALAARSPIPCTAELGDAARRPAAVEAAAYFVINEAITNATKHSGAEHLSITLSGDATVLIVEVRDDGNGGAHESEGGGLAGIRRRAEALDGRMLLSSPAGGPTVVRVELPCGL